MSVFEKVDLNKTISKEEYKSVIDDLELRLAKLQRKAKELRIPIMILFEGWDAAGKGTLINDLIIPLDPRGFKVHSINDPNEEEKLRPFLWRFWTKTPKSGLISIFDRSWYKRTLEERIDFSMNKDEVSKSYTEINAFERQLTDDGTIIMKFFLHISKEEQKKRFKKLEKDSATSWRVTKKDWKHHKQYEKYQKVIEENIEATDTEYAPWTIIEATDRRFAKVKIFTAVINTIEKAIVKKENKKEEVIEYERLEIENLNSSMLDSVDLDVSLEKEEYKKQLKKYQKRLRELEYELFKRRIPLVVVYEGWDAAGKGGNIKRMTKNLDPRGYEVIPVAAPNDIEKAHHYLWRFWVNMPKAGHIAIFDRSWYGRVLVERVEGFCTENEYKRAYREINEMEENITSFGGIVVKFWIHINKDEQLRRFEERQQIPHKKWKITDEDWRNREKWDEYKKAVDEMLFRTSTTYAPWTIIESNSKYHARVKAIKTIIDAIENKIK